MSGGEAKSDVLPKEWVEDARQAAVEALTEHVARIEPCPLDSGRAASIAADAAIQALIERIGTQPVFLVEGYCGSYYCNEHHPVGVFTTREQAEAVTTDTLELQGRHGPEYSSLSVAELPRDRAVLRDDLSMGCR